MNSVFSTWRFIAEHPLGRRQRWSCIAKWARWQVGSRLLPYPIICPFVNDAKLAVERGMTGATGNVYVGLHEFADMAFVLHVLRPGDLFLDLGANVGTYTVLASGVARAQSIACEPIPATFDKLQRNVRLNQIDSLADARCVAVGAAPATLLFIADRDTTNQVAPVGYAGATADVLVTTIDALLEAESLRRGNGIPTTAEPSLVVWKADLEGHESAMLAGARDSLGRGVPHAMIVESDAVQVVRTLEEHAYCRAVYSPFDRQLTRAPDVSGKNNLWILHSSFERVQQRLAAAPDFSVHGMQV